MSEVFKLALPGNDALKASVSNEVVDSLYPNPKINTKANPPHTGIIRLHWVSSGVTVPYDQTNILYSFPHGYGYVPTVFGNYKFDNGSIIRRGTLPFQYGSLGIIVMDADDTNVYLKYFSYDLSVGLTAVPPFEMQVRFYVMAEQGRG